MEPEQTRLCADGGTYLEEPKTRSSRRTIHVGSATVALEQARAIQDNDAEALGDDWLNYGFVFTKPSGEALHPDYITKRFAKDVAETNVTQITLHGLRHTFATTALGAGQNPKYVCDILGHANIQTTLNLYSQYIPGAYAAVVARVESEMFGTGNGDDRD
jgi:integrase